MSERSRRQAVHGRRYSPAEKAEILEDAERLGVKAAAEKHRCSKWTIYDWRKKQARRANKPMDQAAGAASAPPTEEPSAGGAGEEEIQDERRKLVLSIWKQQPGLGPSQIRNQLKRLGLKASVHTVRAIMEEHGYVQPRLKPREHTGRYEAIRPLQLVHLDFCHFHVHKQKQCLFLMVDDFSRFIPGWTLLRSEHADGVMETFDAAVERYGKPEGVMSDRGAAFHSWRGVSRFQRLLDEYGIDFYLAKEAAVNGKAEALNATIRKELLRQLEFDDLVDAQRHIGRWVQFYNYKRTHHSLGGLLVPADRFHGWQEETLRRIEQGQGADMLDVLSPDGRGLEVFKIVSIGGQPAVYLMGQRLLGGQ